MILFVRYPADLVLGSSRLWTSINNACFHHTQPKSSWESSLSVSELRLKLSMLNHEPGSPWQNAAEAYHVHQSRALVLSLLPCAQPPLVKLPRLGFGPLVTAVLGVVVPGWVHIRTLAPNLGQPLFGSVVATAPYQGVWDP